MNEGPALNSSRGFTLLELAIVMAIIAVIAVPFVSAVKLPMSVRATQDGIRSASDSHRRFFNHLSEDVRLADEIRIESEGDEQTLRLKIGDAIVEYKDTEKGLERTTTLARDSRRFFEHIESRFSIETSEQGLGVLAESTLQIPMYRNDLTQNRVGVFLSHLGGEHEKE